MNIIKRHKSILIKIFLCLLIIAFIFLYIKNQAIHKTVNLVLVSFIFAYVLKPIRNFYMRRFNISSKKASVVIMLSITIGIALTLYILIPKMYKELSNVEMIFNKLVDLYENIEQSSKIKNSELFSFIYVQIKEKISKFLVSMSLSIVNNVMKMSENLMSFAVIPVITYYFLTDSKKISKKFYLLVPLKRRAMSKAIIRDIDKLLGDYIVGQLLLSGIVGLSTLIILLVFDVKFPLWLSVFNGIVNVIPYFGPIIGALPIVLIAFLDSTSKGVYILIGVLILQQIEGNILSPRITSDSTNIHPILVIILLILGEQLAGFIGMIIVIPLGVIVKVIYEDINYYLF